MATSSRTVATENVIMSTANPARVAVDSPNSRRGAFTITDVMLIIRANSHGCIPPTTVWKSRIAENLLTSTACNQVARPYLSGCPLRYLAVPLSCLGQSYTRLQTSTSVPQSIPPLPLARCDRRCAGKCRCRRGGARAVRAGLQRHQQSDPSSRRRVIFGVGVTKHRYINGMQEAPDPQSHCAIITHIG